MKHQLSNIVSSEPSKNFIDEGLLHRRVAAAEEVEVEVTTPYHGFVERSRLIIPTCRYRLHLVSRGQGLGVLILSSDMASASRMRLIQDLLASHCRVVILDMLGDGASEFPSEYGHYIEDSVSQQSLRLHCNSNIRLPPWDPCNDAGYIEAIIDSMFERPPILVASGWSCGTGLKLASLDRSKIIGLVLIGPHLYQSQGMDVGRWPSSDAQDYRSRVPESLIPHSASNPQGMRYSQITIPCLILSSGCEGFRLLYLLHNSNCQLRTISPLISSPIVEDVVSCFNDIICWIISTFGHSSLADSFQGYNIARRGDEESVRDNIRCLFFTTSPINSQDAHPNTIPYSDLPEPNLGVQEQQEGPTERHQQDLKIVNVHCRGIMDIQVP